MHYPLDDRQRVLVRALSTGLRDGSVERTVTWINMPSDTVGGKLDQVFTSGISEDRDWEIQREDFRDFEACGFLEILRDNGNAGAYQLFEQVIHNAVDNEFEDPMSILPVSPPTVIVEQGPGSFLNISVNSQHVKQTINASSSLPNDAKAKLEHEAEVLYEILEETLTSKPRESRALEKHLRRLVEDVSEPEPDKQDVTDMLARLNIAALAFVAIAEVASSIEKIGEIIIQLPFMQ